MSDIEHRLRADLAQLADGLLDGDEPAGPTGPTLLLRPGSDGPGGEAAVGLTDEVRRLGRWSERRRSAVAAALALLAGTVGVVAVAESQRSLDPSSEPARRYETDRFPRGIPVDGADDGSGLEWPGGFGSWRALPDAPIGSRSHPVAVWTGSEAVLWGGASPERSSAYAGGAAYDPLTGTWRRFDGPQWAHPLSEGVYHDGSLYLLAKGGGTRVDIASGEMTDLAGPDEPFLAALVSAGEELWGVGPVAFPSSGGEALAVTRYDPGNNDWEPGPVLDDVDPSVLDGLLADRPVLWTGEEIVAWSATGASAAFDPAAGSWTTIDPPRPDVGIVGASLATVTDAGLTAAVEIHDSAEAHVAVAVRNGEAWRWIATRLPDRLPEGSELVGAGEWLMVLRPDDPPLTLHVPTGSWAEHGGVVGGVSGAGAVWTGEDVVIWGGERERGPDGVEPPSGLIWTPPTEPPGWSSMTGAGACPAPTEDVPVQGLVGLPIGFALEGAVHHAYRLGPLRSTTLEIPELETAWTLVMAEVIDPDTSLTLGPALWLVPDPIAATVDGVNEEAPWTTPDSIHLYTANDLAERITPYRRYQGAIRFDLNAVVEICLSD